MKVVIEQLNKYLQTLTPFTDVYNVVIGDKTKVPVDPIEKINDENTGAVANTLMYLKDLKDFLLTQLNILTAEGKWLDRFNKIYGIKRFTGETDAEYIERLIRAIIHLKESPLSIEKILDYYCDAEVVDGVLDTMFSDISFTEYYQSAIVTGYPTHPTWLIVKPARAGMSQGSAFFFMVICTGLDPKYYGTVFFLVQQAHVAGTFFVIIVGEE